MTYLGLGEFGLIAAALPIAYRMTNGQTISPQLYAVYKARMPGFTATPIYAPTAPTPAPAPAPAPTPVPTTGFSIPSAPPPPSPAQPVPTPTPAPSNPAPAAPRPGLTPEAVSPPTPTPTPAPPAPPAPNDTPGVTPPSTGTGAGGSAPPAYNPATDPNVIWDQNLVPQPTSPGVPIGVPDLTMPAAAQDATAPAVATAGGDGKGLLIVAALGAAFLLFKGKR